jgi:beta-glucanase (GH16 family)
MLGTKFPDEKAWPECGEIDIAEWGKSQDTVPDVLLHRNVISGVHYELSDNHQNDYYTYALNATEPAFHEEFHTYKLDWTPNYVRMFVDNQQIFAKDLFECDTLDCTELHEPHFLILNVAVGGRFTGISNPTTGGGEMLVDWIRAYDTNLYDTEAGPAVLVTPCDGPCPVEEYVEVDELRSGVGSIARNWVTRVFLVIFTTFCSSSSW